ncbi:feline leukemia virus subgroup C receptor-related protein 2-like [Hydractinia symbiolongicarpus]|uniref:feline leukemia virus subgroup C receptor-related protein 2-like n=1 Tax=Hydractinia symbiolongicarpus TaxID=13093 RepID=UPI00254C0A23|nr:feline leukemia virus subgroup C receptor-related protein 2-like [Hydractinia symbiolongicarpus]
MEMRDKADIMKKTEDKSKENNKFRLYKRRWIVLAVFSLISMTNEVIWISLSSITSIVKAYYNVSYVAVNMLSMIYMIFYVFVIVSAYLLDKQGLKFTIVIGGALNGIGSCLRLIGASRDGFVYAFLGNASAALAQCFILFVPPTLAAVWFGEKERATASAIGVLMNMLGVAVGFLMGGTMVPSSENYDDGMFNTLMAQAVFCTFLVILSVILIRNAPSSPPSMSQLLILESKHAAAKKTNKNRVGTKAVGDADKQVAAAGESSKASTDSNVKTAGFLQNLKSLSKDKAFHLVTQSYGLYFGLFAAYNTVLNQMCMVNYPGKEKEIGLMGFTSVLLGLVGILLAGIWIDRTSRYKSISIGTFTCCSVALLIFTLLLQYGGNFTLVFVSFCIFGFFSYPYMTVGLEHAAEVTYPIPEGITSGILLLLGNIYGIILTFILGAIIEKGRADVAGYVMVVIYTLGLVVVICIKGELKRLKTDRLKLNEKLAFT